MDIATGHASLSNVVIENESPRSLEGVRADVIRKKRRFVSEKGPERRVLMCLYLGRGFGMFVLEEASGEGASEPNHTGRQ